MSAISDFKEFILRGNVVDLAVGVVIGAAFGKIVDAFVKDIITPLIAIPGDLGKTTFNDLSFVVHGSKFPIGDFINVVISFLLIALVVFFFVVKPVNYLMERQKRNAEPEVAPELTREEVLLTEIRDALKARTA